MPTFSLPTGAYVYRPLKKGDQGWDVYALQTALNEFGDLKLDEDGVFGDDTHTKTVRYQRNRGLVADGIAGVVTQRTLAIQISNLAKEEYRLADGHLKGQLEKESAFWLGNHTPLYSNGSRDLGVAQRNDRYATWQSSFHVHESINELASRIRNKYDLYKSWNKVGNDRCWELAAGSWNAPSWTDTLAKGGTLSPSAREWIEAYIDRVTVYVTSWPQS